MPNHEQPHHQLPVRLTDEQTALVLRPFAYQLEPKPTPRPPQEGDRIKHLGDYLATPQAAAYIAAARIARMRIHDATMRGKPSMTHYRDRAMELVAQQPQAFDGLEKYVTLTASCGELLQFFAWNFAGIIALPGRVARRNQRLPTDQGIGSLPEFSTLNALLQGKIVQQFAGEWRQLCDVLYEHDADLLRVGIINARKQPLALWSASDLKRIIALNPSVQPARLCCDFLRKPGDFIKSWRRPEPQQANVVEKSKPPAQTRYVLPKPPKDPLKVIIAAEDIDLQLESLSVSPDVNVALLESNIGELLPLGPQGVELSRDRADTLIAQNLQFIGRSLYRNIVGEHPQGRGLQFIEGRGHAVGLALRGDCGQGTIQNVTIGRKHTDSKTLLTVKPPSPRPTALYIDHLEIAAEIIEADRIARRSARVLLVLTMGTLNLDKLAINLYIPEGSNQEQ